MLEGKCNFQKGLRMDGERLRELGLFSVEKGLRGGRESNRTFPPPERCRWMGNREEVNPSQEYTAKGQEATVTG